MVASNIENEHSRPVRDLSIVFVVRVFCIVCFVGIILYMYSILN